MREGGGGRAKKFLARVVGRAGARTSPPNPLSIAEQWRGGTGRRVPGGRVHVPPLHPSGWRGGQGVRSGRSLAPPGKGPTVAAAPVGPATQWSEGGDGAQTTPRGPAPARRGPRPGGRAVPLGGAGAGLHGRLPGHARRLDRQHRPAHAGPRVRHHAQRRDLGDADLRDRQHRPGVDAGPPGRHLRPQNAVRGGLRDLHGRGRVCRPWPARCPNCWRRARCRPSARPACWPTAPRS